MYYYISTAYIIIIRGINIHTQHKHSRWMWKEGNTENKKRIWKNKNMKQYLVNMKVNICQLKILLFHICLHLNTPTSKTKLITYYKRPEPLFFIPWNVLILYLIRNGIFVLLIIWQHEEFNHLSSWMINWMILPLVLISQLLTLTCNIKTA